MAIRINKFCLVTALLLMSSFAVSHAQNVAFTLTEITCHGASDATMKMERLTGTSTYWFVYFNLTDPSKSDSVGPTNSLEYTFTNLPAGDLLVFYVRDAITDLYLGSTYVPGIADKEPITATVSSSNVSCFGALTGSITIGGAAGGTGVFDYTINGGDSWQTAGNYTGLAAGTYKVRIRDRNNPGCITILNDDLKITTNPQMNATVTSTNVTCNNAANGTISITNPTGGSGNYEFTITGGTPWSSAVNYTSLIPGTYNVVMRDATTTSCTRVLNNALAITQPNQLAVQDIVINKGLTCNEGSDGILQAIVTGGTPPYTYTWNLRVGSSWVPIGQTTPAAVNLAQGRYQVVVNDAGGCGPANAVEYFFLEFTDSIPPVFNYNGAVATSSCAGQSNGSIDLSASGGKKPYRFSITTGGASGYQADSLFSNLAAGTYQPWVMDKKGCKKTGPDVVIASTPNVPVSVSIAANPSGSICPGTSVLFTATPVNGGTAPGYQWRLNGVATGTNSPTYTNSSLAAGDQVRVILTSDIRCTTGNPATSNTITAALKTATAITAQPQPLSQCAGTNATFNVSANGTNLTYQWRKNGTNISGATGSSYTINNIAAGDAATYSVVVTGDCGVITSGNAALVVNASTIINTQPQPLVRCAGTSATFSVAAAGTNLTYQWRKNGTPITGATQSTYTIASVAAGDAGNYSVVVTGDCGGSVTSSSVSLTVNPATAITVQPLPLTQCAGTTATFSVTAVGTNLTYQWKKNGVDIPGATSATYIINNIGLPDARNYSVVVTGDCGPAVTSNSVALALYPTTAITIQPQPISQCIGTNATFSVTAAGTNISYQWQKNGTAIPGANAGTYTITGITAANAGNYSVVISGDCGPNVTSNTVSLTVNPLTAITAHPVAVAQCVGTSATFTVAATGSNLTYQWRKNNINITGATGSSYTISVINSGDAATYTVAVDGDCGEEVISNPATLTVNPATAITVQPTAVTQCVGTAASFSVTATGTGLGYQWRKNGADIPGATSATYSIPAIASGDAGNYSVVVSGSCGNSVTSNAVSLTVNPETAITVQPQPVTICAGSSATFTVTASGVTLAYQWKKDGTNIAGATNSTYTIPSVSATHAGNYSVVVTGGCGAAVTSNSVALTLNAPTVINQHPAPVTECTGSMATFTVDADGLNLNYQWRKNGTSIPGATGSSYTIASIATTDAGNYTVVVNGLCGSVTSNAAALTVNTDPVITTQPQAVNQCAGTDATFTVAASGANLNYVWRKNGNPIVPAQTGTSLTLTDIDAADAGNYDVVITNTCGDVTSNSVQLIVADNPVITQQPFNQALCEGGDVSFTVNATGSGLSYQWRKDGVNLAGQTSPALDLTSVTLSNGGTYDVLVYGLCDTLTSGPAVLLVDESTSADISSSDTIVCKDGDVKFNAVAGGTGSLDYQWQRLYYGAWIDVVNDSRISGATTSSLTIQTAEYADTGYYRIMVTGDCGSALSDEVRLDVNSLIATIGTPAPFLINSTTTFIEAGVTITNHFLKHDLGFSLVAPDGTEVILKAPSEFCVPNHPVNFNIHFNTDADAADTLNYCTPTSNVTGTYAATGDWSVLDGMDPSNGAWQIRVYDAENANGDAIDGIITSATLTFIDLNNEGDTAIVAYNSGTISTGILNPISAELRPTSYVVPIRLMTTCFNSEDARAIVTVQGGVAPFTYEWTGPTTEEDDSDVMLGPGTYSVLVTDAIGCTSVATVEVTAPPAITYDQVEISDTLACFGSEDGFIRSKALGGSGSIRYVLLPGNIPSEVADSGVFTGLGAGIYTVRATDLNGCSLDTVMTLTQREELVVELDIIPVIGENPGSITLTATGGLAPYQYSIDNGVTMQDNGIFTNLPAGIYPVMVVDSLGCTFTADVNLSVQLLNVDVTVHDVSCYGLADGSFYLALIDGTGPYTLTGSFTDTLTLASGAFAFTGQTAGVYDIKIEDSEGSMFLDTITINEPDEITASGMVIHATCSALSEDGSVDVIVLGGSGVYTFEWSNGATTEDISNLQAGVYRLIVSDANGCSSEEFDFDVAGLNEATAYAGENDTICPGTEYQLFGSPIADSVFWEPAELLNDNRLTNPMATIETRTPFVYTVYDNGCMDRDTVVIDIHPRIGMDIYDPSGAQMSIGDSLYLLEGETATMAATPGFITYRWEPIAGLSDPNAEAVVVSPASTTFYTVFGTTDKGCIESDMVKVVIARQIKIYSGFSPNGDNYNQTWKIENAYQYGERIRIRVFNRWGELIFESKGYSVEWDGTRNGRQLPVGAYYYIIDVKDGKTEPYTGTVTILR